MVNSFLDFKTTKDQGVGIGVLCVLPLIVLIIFAISFSIKTSRDLCNSANYTCDPPTTPTTPTNPSSTKAPTQALKQVKPTEKFDIRQCGNPKLKPGHNLVDPSSILNGYLWPAIVFVLLTIVLVIVSGFFHNIGTGDNSKNLWRYFFGNDGLTEEEKGSYVSKLFTWSVLLIFLPLTITAIVYLALKKNKANNIHIGFSISLINFILSLILALFLSSDKSVTDFFWAKPNSGTSYAAAILGVILIILVIGTIYFHTSQEANLDEGRITYAINESVVNMMAAIIVVLALVNLLVGGSMTLVGIKKADQQNNVRADGKRILLGGTQIISGVLLIAAAAYFYTYKSKCNSATVICDYTFKRINRSEGNDTCVPDSGMSMTHTSAVNMSIGLNVIMSLVQIVGTIVIILLKPSGAAAVAAAATPP